MSGQIGHIRLSARHINKIKTEKYLRTTKNSELVIALEIYSICQNLDQAKRLSAGLIQSLSKLIYVFYVYNNVFRSSILRSYIQTVVCTSSSALCYVIYIAYIYTVICNCMNTVIRLVYAITHVAVVVA